MWSSRGGLGIPLQPHSGFLLLWPLEPLDPRARAVWGPPCHHLTSLFTCLPSGHGWVCAHLGMKTAGAPGFWNPYGIRGSCRFGGQQGPLGWMKPLRAVPAGPCPCSATCSVSHSSLFQLPQPGTVSLPAPFLTAPSQLPEPLYIYHRPSLQFLQSLLQLSQPHYNFQSASNDPHSPPIRLLCLSLPLFHNPN